jgi:hypothetical protein
MKCRISKEFNRKCRSLKELKHWKATELRTFILCVGPAALKGILSDKHFKHFMLLHCSIFILCSHLAYDNEWVVYSGQLLNLFVSSVSDLYYKEFYVYNVHSLLHLHSDVMTLGPLDCFSAFEFENSMQYLKKMIRMNRAHLSQVVRRVRENNGCTFVNEIPNHVSQCTFSCNMGDNCFMTADCKVFVITSRNSLYFECYEFLHKSPFDGYPCGSRKFGIYIVKNASPSLRIRIKDVFKKCLLLPFGNDYVCVPIIHSL